MTKNTLEKFPNLWTWIIDLIFLSSTNIPGPQRQSQSRHRHQMNINWKLSACGGSGSGIFRFSHKSWIAWENNINMERKHGRHSGHSVACFVCLTSFSLTRFPTREPSGDTTVTSINFFQHTLPHIIASSHDSCLKQEWKCWQQSHVGESSDKMLQGCLLKSWLICNVYLLLITILFLLYGF